jgi:hypothetical protein
MFCPVNYFAKDVTVLVTTVTNYIIIHLYHMNRYLLIATTDTEHDRPARWTYTLGCRLSIFHGDSFSTFHFFLGATFYAICFHFQSSRYMIAHNIFKTR